MDHRRSPGPLRPPTRAQPQIPNPNPNPNLTAVHHHHLNQYNTHQFQVEYTIQRSQAFARAFKPCVHCIFPNPNPASCHRPMCLRVMAKQQLIAEICGVVRKRRTISSPPRLTMTPILIRSLSIPLCKSKPFLNLSSLHLRMESNPS